ncbi:MAG: ECF transporter S component [Clostridia bacterium]|nr:ECF transporter S component [Clostridia bacterium]
MKNKTKNLVMIGLFCAIAFVFTNIGHLIPIRFAGFLSFDPKDAIIVIAGFALGPYATIVISVIVALIELLSISTTGIIGFVMNIIASVAFAFVPALVYKTTRTFKSAMVSLLFSSALTVALMLLWNFLITPIYMHVPREAVEGMLLPVFLPFNLIKCVMNTVLVSLLYKPMVKILRRVKLLPPSRRIKRSTNKARRKISTNSINKYVICTKRKRFLNK